MTVEGQPPVQVPHSSSTGAAKADLKEIQEKTGASTELAREIYLANGCDVSRTVAFLTNAREQKESSKGESLPQNREEVIEIADDKDDDLARAIELSLREATGGVGSSISEEDREISKALEASLAEKNSGNKRKRGSIWLTFADPENPHDRERKEGVPVGLKNVGNTCWFSAVIQSLFQIPKFRYLVFRCCCQEELENLKDKPKMLFFLELQRLFALLLYSKRKYVDPAKPIEVLEEATRGYNANNGDQQDVSEFTHVLFDWLEESFKELQKGSATDNPIEGLFYGKYNVEGCYDGKESHSEETFGAIPVRVRGHSHLYDSLDDAMVNKVIEASKDGNSNSSIQEHWFTHLPSVLIFELSRFRYNQHMGTTEKIHDALCFQQTIYLARYMEANKAITRQKRLQVDRLKARRANLQTKLEKYLAFGSGPKKSPILTTLDSTLEFIRCSLSKETDSETPMMISPGSSPTTGGCFPSTSGMNVLENAEKVDGPTPKTIRDEDRELIEQCLRRWRKEAEQEAEALRLGIEYIDGQIKQTYEEERLNQIPYRLHAILVHEGQANGGHYWSFICDSVRNVWRKFNDITVSEITWEELLRESTGGYRNVSAYCLLYVDATRKDLFNVDDKNQQLPESIRKFVDADNNNFRLEIEEWDTKRSSKESENQTASVKPGTSSQEVEMKQEECSNIKSPKHSRPDPTKGLDERLNIILENEYKFLVNICTNSNLTNSREDCRLEHFGSYLIKSGAPKDVILTGLLHHFVENERATEYDIVLLQKHGRWKLGKLIENSEDYQMWNSSYKVFLEASASFVTGIEYYYSKRHQQAVCSFAYALEMNEQLHNAQHKPGHLDSYLLAHYRRQSLEEFNQDVCKNFQSDDDALVLKAHNLVINIIFPITSRLNEKKFEEDFRTTEHIRAKWFALLTDENFEGERQELLQDVLTKLVEGPERTQPIPLPLKPQINASSLSERYKRAFRKITENRNS